MDNTQPTRIRALEISRYYVGKEEVPRGSNWGAFVQSTLATVGITFPAAWCMAFVYRCYREAATPCPAIKTGGVLECWRRSKNKLLKSNATPQNVLAGYQFIYDHGHGKGHTGLVVSIDANGLMTTIEGNSNTDGSREGYAVCELKKRRLSDAGLLGFVMY